MDEINALIAQQCEIIFRLHAELDEIRELVVEAYEERDAAEDAVNADVSDALAEYLHSIGQPAKPLRSTGNRALDELVRICG